MIRLVIINCILRLVDLLEVFYYPLVFVEAEAPVLFLLPDVVDWVLEGVEPVLGGDEVLELLLKNKWISIKFLFSKRFKIIFTIITLLTKIYYNK